MDGGVPAGRFAAKADLRRKAFNGKWPEETSAVLRFRSYTVFVQAACGLQVQNLKCARARMEKVSDLVKRCDQPGKVLIQT